MRLLKMMGMGLAVFAMTAILPARADALLLELGPGAGGETYTLFVQDNCTSGCVVSLTIDYDNANTYYDGQFINAVQFGVDGNAPDGTPVLTAAPGSTTDWETSLGVIQGGPGDTCGSGNDNFTCTEWTFTVSGYPVPTDGSTLYWEWLVDWTTDSFTSGNVRARYVDAAGNQYGQIFSPGGGNFGGNVGGGEAGREVPEPVSLSLFGLGLFGAACRARRRIG
jgi:hypothetical protein